MNLIAEQALARALAAGAKPIPAHEVLPIAAVEPVPVPAIKNGHFDRVGYLEGRRHALAIVSDARLLLELQGGTSQVVDRLRQCMQGKPASFAKGVESIIDLVMQEVGQ
ncbi:hypothetical protein [Aquipseudomonas campi]